MSLAHSLRNLRAVWRTHGTAELIRTVRHRWSERYYERYFDVDTAAPVAHEALALGDAQCHGYEATDYATLFRALRRAQLGREDVFLDYGCGKGRAMLVAASFPCRRVIGLDLNSTLVGQANGNVARARRRLRAGGVEAVVAAADRYVVPPDVTFAYFFNPFRGRIMLDTLERLRESVRAQPRDLRLLFRWHGGSQLAADLQPVSDLVPDWTWDYSRAICYRLYRFRT